MTEVFDLSAGRKAQDHAGTDLWTRLLLRLARHVRCGAIRLTLPGGQTLQVSGERAGPQAELTIRRPRFARRLLLGGGAFSELAASLSPWYPDGGSGKLIKACATEAAIRWSRTIAAASPPITQRLGTRCSAIRDSVA